MARVPCWRPWRQSAVATGHRSWRATVPPAATAPTPWIPPRRGFRRAHRDSVPGPGSADVVNSIVHDGRHTGRHARLPDGPDRLSPAPGCRARARGIGVGLDPHAAAAIDNRKTDLGKIEMLPPAGPADDHALPPWLARPAGCAHRSAAVHPPGTSSAAVRSALQDWLPWEPEPSDCAGSNRSHPPRPLPWPAPGVQKSASKCQCERKAMKRSVSSRSRPRSTLRTALVRLS